MHELNFAFLLKTPNMFASILLLPLLRKEKGTNILLHAEDGNLILFILRIKPLPATKRYGSLLFPDFEAGFSFMERVTREGCRPASIR